MSYHNLGVRLQSRLDFARLPLPEYKVSSTISTADPLAVRRKPYLASITSNRVACKPLVPRLPEVIGTVYKDLIVHRLSSKVFLCIGTLVNCGSISDCDDILLGCRVTAGIECMYGSAIYLITTGMSKSHALMVLSSEVVTNRLFSSTKVIEFTGPRC